MYMTRVLFCGFEQKTRICAIISSRALFTIAPKAFFKTSNIKVLCAAGPRRAYTPKKGNSSKNIGMFLYDEHEERALLTLKHEFIDYHITKEIVEPLIKYINMQKCLIEDLVYSRKERLVKRILRLLSPT